MLCSYRRNLMKIYNGYQMSIGLILNLLNELNKSILCEPLTSVIHVLFYSTSSLNLVLNLHEFNNLFITYPPKRTLILIPVHDSSFESILVTYYYLGSFRIPASDGSLLVTYCCLGSS